MNRIDWFSPQHYTRAAVLYIFLNAIKFFNLPHYFAYKNIKLLQIHKSKYISWDIISYDETHYEIIFLKILIV